MNDLFIKFTVFFNTVNNANVIKFGPSKYQTITENAKKKRYAK